MVRRAAQLLHQLSEEARQQRVLVQHTHVAWLQLQQNMSRTSGSSSKSRRSRKLWMFGLENAIISGSGSSELMWCGGLRS
jgi:hypothetical protein